MAKDFVQGQLDRELAQHIYRSRENMPVHFYEDERWLLSCVRHGDTERLATRTPLSVPKVHGPSADDPFRKFLYDMVALVTLVTRAAIEGGMYVETAYTLSDLYIRRLDSAKSMSDLVELGRRAIWDFTTKVSQLRRADTAKSLPVRRCVEFVRSRLHEKVTLGEAAEFCGLSEKYLSRLFLNQTGQKFHEFVQSEKIFESCRLLAHTDMTIKDIASTLAFSSQSYFTKIFAEQTGDTPQRYREKFR